VNNRTIWFSYRYLLGRFLGRLRGFLLHQWWVWRPWAFGSNFSNQSIPNR